MLQLQKAVFDLTSITLDTRRTQSDTSVLFTQTSKTILVHYSNYLQVSGWISPLMKAWCFLCQNWNCKIKYMYIYTYIYL